MAGTTRVTTGRRSREPGTTVGMEVNVFGLTALEAGINGEAIAPILLEALQPALIEARGEWPILTGASIESMETVISEIGLRHARAVLQVGGAKLIADPRNVSRKDYAPFIEFNGSPTGRGQHSISNAIFGNDRQIRADVKAGIKLLIEGIVSGL